jgi:hypothetical protein
MIAAAMAPGCGSGASGRPPVAPVGESAPDESRQGAAAVTTSPSGGVTATTTVVTLSPSAAIQAEKFRCVCGCEMSLGQCTCHKTPGSIDMKQYLESLVDRKLSPADIAKEMAAKYGAQVIAP